MAHQAHRKSVFILDADTLGLSAAVLCGAIVFAVGLWRESDFLQVLVWTGLACLVSYGAVFVFVRCILWILLSEMVSQRPRRPAQEAETDAENAETAEK